jgi:hypothetical protein
MLQRSGSATDDPHVISPPNVSRRDEHSLQAPAAADVSASIPIPLRTKVSRRRSMVNERLLERIRSERDRLGLAKLRKRPHERNFRDITGLRCYSQGADVSRRSFGFLFCIAAAIEAICQPEDFLGVHQYNLCLIFERAMGVVLVIDNSSFHESDEIVAVVTSVRVQIVTFAPDTTHIFQMLDVVLFDAVKKHATGVKSLDEEQLAAVFLLKVYHDFKQTMTEFNIWAAIAAIGFIHDSEESP